MLKHDTTELVDPAAEWDREPSSYQLAILRALQGKHMYGGTVPAKVVAKRRARDKVARKSRRINRGNR